MAPAISYAQQNVTLAVNSPISTLEPSNSGGAAVIWSVSPGLLIGLTLNANNGTISGTPTAPAAPATYTITAKNSGGSSTFNLSITVVSLGTQVVSNAEAYSGSNINSPVALAIDASDNVWVANLHGGITLIRPTPGGSCPIDCTAYPLTQDSSADFYDVAIDAAGNALVPQPNGLYRISLNGTITSCATTAPTGAAVYTGNYLAIDGSGEVWLSGYEQTGLALLMNHVVPDPDAGRFCRYQWNR